MRHDFAKSDSLARVTHLSNSQATAAALAESKASGEVSEPSL